MHATLWPRLGEALTRGWEAPAYVRAPTAEQLAEQAESRKANLVSLVHNGDIHLRKAIGQVMGAAEGDKKYKANLIKSLTMIRKDMLAQLREGRLEGASGEAIELEYALVGEGEGFDGLLEEAMVIVTTVFRERAAR